MQKENICKGSTNSNNSEDLLMNLSQNSEFLQNEQVSQILHNSSTSSNKDWIKILLYKPFGKDLPTYSKHGSKLLNKEKRL